MFFCAISGEPPQDPVVSQKSGHVYERRLIFKYIAENGTDPMTGEKLEESDLITIQANPKTSPPRPPTLTSIPALLQTLQNEWDALVLETFALKQQLNSTRQELSHSLYQQDAATRVAGRLLRERDAAREALASVKATMGIDASTSGDVDMQDGSEELGLPSDIASEIEEKSKDLFSTRKKRTKPPADYPTAGQIGSFNVARSIPSLHSSSPSGINSLALSRTQPSLFLTGGNDKIVQLYDQDAGKVAAVLKGHTKKVMHVQFREKEGDPLLILSASPDKTARIWGHDTASGKYALKHTIKQHKGDITGLAVHPTQRLVALASADGTYSLHDLTSLQPVYQSADSGDSYSALSIHPDGLLLGLGNVNSTIQIFDIRSGKVGASVAPPSISAPFNVNQISFSENGYNMMALASADPVATVAIWDLRKQPLPEIVHSIELGNGVRVRRIVGDPCGQFIGVAGTTGGAIYHRKTGDLSFRFDADEEVSDLQFSHDGKEIWSVCGREVKVWSAP